MPLVSIILPVFNEGKVLERNIRNLEGILASFSDDFEIIISEDGSTDDTVDVAGRLRSDRIRVLHNGKRKGKGFAIKSAAGYARSNILVFMDADLASKPEQVKRLIELTEGGAAMVIGSRYHKDSKAKRNPIRYMASRSFNYLVRLLLGSGLSDHQCGFKAFRKDLVLPVINEIQDDGWFWDTELLVRAQRKGLRIAEMPIEWKEAQDSKFRLLRDTVHMAHGLIAFKMKHI